MRDTDQDTQFEHTEIHILKQTIKPSCMITAKSLLVNSLLGVGLLLQLRQILVELKQDECCLKNRQNNTTTLKSASTLPLPQPHYFCGTNIFIIKEELGFLAFLEFVV